jgi:hemerythrin-like domain-containing protein
MRHTNPAPKPARFLHFEAPAGYDDPIGMLLGCHRRIEKKLATLKALCAHLRRKGVDAEASAAAQAVLRYFSAPAAHHHDDEEVDLFPLLDERIGDPEERERLQGLAKRLAAEHEEMEATWARLRKPLEGVAEGLMRSVPESEAQAFATLYERHIETEEALVVPLVDRWLRPEDLHALGRAMALRRGAPLPGQLP